MAGSKVARHVRQHVVLWHAAADGVHEAEVVLRNGIALIRPLLGVRKHALMAYLQQCEQPWIDDPSNQNLRYARNRLRTVLTDQQAQQLWHEAQQQGAALHQADLTRNAWLAAHAEADDAAIARANLAAGDDDVDALLLDATLGASSPETRSEVVRTYCHPHSVL